MSVSDFGNGVPDHLKEAIFDRFSQVEDSDAKQGAGLDLAICKAIIELHSGSIGVEDIEPKGSKFWIQLP
jgi:signal transduction histidine kinase